MGHTPLHICALSGHVPTARVLLEHGADLEARDNNGGTPLHLASANHEEMVDLFLKHGVSVMSTLGDFVGYTALHIAALSGKTEIVRLLIVAGSDVNAPDSSGRTPLHLSASLGWVDVVRLLLDNGAELNAVNNFGLTPAAFAKLSGHEELARGLEERSCRSNELISPV